MRVIMVEFAGADDAAIGGFLESHAVDVTERRATPVARGEGQLRDERPGAGRSTRTAGEPA